MHLEEITANITLTGLEPNAVVTVLAVARLGDDAVQVIYQAPGSTEIRQQMLMRANEAALAVATQERPWSFDGDGATVVLAVEAKRIDLAYLFDPMMAARPTCRPLPRSPSRRPGRRISPAAWR